MSTVATLEEQGENQESVLVSVRLMVYHQDVSDHTGYDSGLQLTGNLQATYHGRHTNLGGLRPIPTLPLHMPRCIHQKPRRESAAAHIGLDKADVSAHAAHVRVVRAEIRAVTEKVRYIVLAAVACHRRQLKLRAPELEGLRRGRHCQCPRCAHRGSLAAGQTCWAAHLHATSAVSQPHVKRALA